MVHVQLSLYFLRNCSWNTKTSTFVDDFAGKLCVVVRITWKEPPNGDSSDAENSAQGQVDGQGELAAERVQEDKGLYNNVIGGNSFVFLRIQNLYQEIGEQLNASPDHEV